ncbi:MAG: ABC transporter permease [Flavonifractor plautii]
MNVLVSLFNSLPGAAGPIWGIMAIGVYITYKILDVADLTVDGSWLPAARWRPVRRHGLEPLAGGAGGGAGGYAGRAGHRVLHTACGIPAILAGILAQLALYSINLRIMAIGDENAAKATLAVSVDKNDLLLSSRYVREPALNNPLLLLVLLTAAVIALLYWFFGTEQGSALRATGANQSMARAQGINTNTTRSWAWWCPAAGGPGRRPAGQVSGQRHHDMGRGAIVIGLAAVIIGEVLLDKVFRNFALKLLSAVIGAIIYYVVITVVLRLGLESTDLKLLTALVVAVFLAVPYWKGRYFTKPVRKEGAPHA